MRISIFGDPALIAVERVFVEACVSRMLRRAAIDGNPDGHHALHMHNPRTSAGWLEATILHACDDAGEGGRFVCALQRTLSADMEFVS